MEIIEDRGGGWLAVIVPTSQTIGFYPAGRGPTPLDAAEDAQRLAKSGDVPLASGEVVETLTIQQSLSVAIEEDETLPVSEDLSVRHIPPQLPQLAADFERNIGWVRLGDDSWMVFVSDKNGSVLDMGAGDNLDDLLLGVYEQLQPATEQ